LGGRLSPFYAAHPFYGPPARKETSEVEKETKRLRELRRLNGEWKYLLDFLDGLSKNKREYLENMKEISERIMLSYDKYTKKVRKSRDEEYLKRWRNEILERYELTDDTEGGYIVEMADYWAAACGVDEKYSDVNNESDLKSSSDSKTDLSGASNFNVPEQGDSDDIPF
jgi:hypothetical protein